MNIFDYLTVVGDGNPQSQMFFDIPVTYWAHSQIMNVVDKNIMSGCGGGFFCTGNAVTRAMAAEYIIKAMGQQPSTAAYNTYFNDLYPDYMAEAGYINRMYELGIAANCGTQAYCPGSDLTKSEGAVQTIKAKGELPSSAPYSAYFDDIANDSFAGYINSMYELGITTGCGTRAYCPSNPVTKDQMAVFLNNIALSTIPTYSVAGMIKNPSGVAISGITVTVTLPGNYSATTDTNGAYSIGSLLNGIYTVTPSKTGYTFTPANRTVTVNGANVAGQDFTALSVGGSYSIAGKITTAGPGGMSNPLVGVTVTLSGVSSTTTVTDSNGNYTFGNLTNGIYTVTPSMSGYVFTPVNRGVTVNGANVTGENFTRQ